MSDVASEWWFGFAAASCLWAVISCCCAVAIGAFIRRGNGDG